MIPRAAASLAPSVARASAAGSRRASTLSQNSSASPTTSPRLPPPATIAPTRTTPTAGSSIATTSSRGHAVASATTPARMSFLHNHLQLQPHHYIHTTAALAVERAGPTLAQLMGFTNTPEQQQQQELKYAASILDELPVPNSPGLYHSVINDNMIDAAKAHLADIGMMYPNVSTAAMDELKGRTVHAVGYAMFDERFFFNLVLRNNCETATAFFTVAMDGETPTGLSNKTASFLGIETADSFCIGIGEFSHVVRRLPRGYGPADLNILGQEFMKEHRLGLFRDPQDPERKVYLVEEDPIDRSDVE